MRSTSSCSTPRTSSASSRPGRWRATTARWSRAACEIKAMGNDLLRTIGGRAIHPINVRVGGFYKAPSRADLERARPGARGGARVRARVGRLGSPGSTSPTSSRTTSSSRSAIPDRYAIEDGRLVSGSGLDIGPGEYEEHFTEMQVPHSTALQSRMTRRRHLLPRADGALLAQLRAALRRGARGGRRGRSGGELPQPVQVDRRPGGGDPLRVRRGARA